MKRVNKCARPECSKKFGLVRYFQRCEAYCSQSCKKRHTAQITAESEQKRKFLQFLCS